MIKREHTSIYFYHILYSIHLILYSYIYPKEKREKKRNERKMNQYKKSKTVYIKTTKRDRDINNLY